MSKKSSFFIKKKLPHVSQKNDMGCHFAAITMLLKYLGVDTCLIEVMHHSGVAHSLCSRPKFLKFNYIHAFLPSIIPMIDSGNPISQGIKDLNFLGSLFGLKCDYRSPNGKNGSYGDWEDYLESIKNYIKRDIPVYVGVDPIVWPVYRESWDINGNHYFNRGGHAIVVIGFDEEKNEIFFHDPYDFRIDIAKCKGASISIDVFKKAVIQAYSPIKKLNFTTIIFRRQSEPMSNEEIFNMVKERNLRRMQGDLSAYDKDLCQNLSCFGIKAVEAFREDLQTMQSSWKEIFYKFLTFFKYPSIPFEDFIVSSYRISEQKFEVAHFLQDNKKFTEINKKVALRLQAEALYWKQLVYLFTKWNYLIKNNSIGIIVKEVPAIIDKILIVLKKIIQTEEEIINTMR